MKKTSNRGLAAALSAMALAASLGACSDRLEQPADNFENESLQAFINRYGVPDPNHDWSMVKKAPLTVKSDKPVGLRIFADVDGKRYIFADLKSYQGNDSLPVLLPKNVDRLILEVNGSQEYICSPDDAVDLDALASAPRSRDYIDYDLAEPADGKDYGQVTVDFTTSSDKGRVIKYDIAENEALLTIINSPYDSPHILSEEYVAKDGTSVKDPLMPSIGGITIAQKDREINNRFADYEFMPVYVRNASPNNTTAEYKLGTISKEITLDNVRYVIGRGEVTFGSNTTYNIGYVNEAGETVYITNPTSDNSTWTGKTVSVCANDRNFEFGLRYNITFEIGNDYPYSTGTYKQTYPYERTWDTVIGGPTDAYSSCLYFNDVPFTYVDGSGTKKTEKVFVYGIFRSPTETAQTRPDKPDFYIMELYNHDLLIHRPEYPYVSQPYGFRLMAEDLGSTDDWDFNDVVADFTVVLTNRVPDFGDGHEGINPGTSDYYADKWLIENIGHQYIYHITVTPRAAGGIYPVYLGYHGRMFDKLVDISALKGKKVSEVMKMSPEQLAAFKTSAKLGNYQIGQEMHKWLGAGSTDEMINTTSVTHTGKTVEFDVDGHYTTFSVIVDKENELQSQPVSGQDYSLIDESDRPYQNNFNPRPDGDLQGKYKLVPQKMLLTTDFPWARERVDFGSAYPEFINWINNVNYGKGWYTTRDRNLTVEPGN